MSDRIAELQDKIREQGADLLVLAPGPSMTWLTGHAFESHERLFLLYVRASGAPSAILPALEQDNWSTSVPAVERCFLWDDKDGPGDAAAAACAQFGSVSSIAIEPLGMRYMEYMAVLEQLPGREFVAAVDGRLVDSCFRRWPGPPSPWRGRQPVRVGASRDRVRAAPGPRRRVLLRPRGVQ